MNTRTRLGGWLGALAGFLLVVGMAGAADRLWTDGGVGSNWSTDDNWNPAQAPTAADVAVFTNGGSSSAIDLSTQTIADWRFDSADTVMNYLNLSGNTLAVTGGVYVAHIANQYARVTVSNGTFQIGAPGGPGVLQVGHVNPTAHWQGYADGILTLKDGVTWDATNLGVVSIGRNMSSLRHPTDTGPFVIGIVDAASAAFAGQRLQATDLVVGDGRGTWRAASNYNYGYFKLPASGLTNLTVTGTLGIGGSVEGGGYGRIGVEANDWKLPAGLSLTVGQSAAARGALVIGRHGYEVADGRLVAATNGSLTAYLSELRVGGPAASGIGLLDLRTMDGMELDATTLTVGAGSSAYLPAGTGTVGTVTVGSGTSGTVPLELHGSRLNLTSGMTVAPNGRVVVRLRGASCGWDVASGATIATQTDGALAGEIALIYEQDSADDPYWGLRWKGDRTASGIKVVGDTTALSGAKRYVYAKYDPGTDYTYWAAWTEPPPPTTDNLIWTGGAATPTWGDLDNWDLKRAPANPTPGSLQFANVTSGSNLLDEDRQINKLIYHRADSSIYTTDLNGKTLTATGGLDVARSPQNLVSDVRAVITNGTLQVGMPGQRAELAVGRYTSTAHFQGYADGILTLKDGVTWVATNLSVVSVGRNNSSGNHPAQVMTGVLDTRAAVFAGQQFRATDLVIGDGRGINVASGYNYGYVKLPASGLTNLTVAGTLGIGGSVARAGYGRLGVETNSWKLPVGMSLTVGQSIANRGKLIVGYASGTANGQLADGRLVAATNGWLTAFLSELRVGSSGGAGLLDLRTMDGMELDATTLTVGAGGTVWFPAGTGKVGTVTVGEASGSAGILGLQGSMLNVSGKLTVNATGRITNTVDGASSGVSILSGSTSDLSIAAGGRLHIEFGADAPGGQILWGVRIIGTDSQYVDLLQGYLDSDHITTDASALKPSRQLEVGVHQDLREGFTYIGLPAVPGGSLFLLR